MNQEKYMEMLNTAKTDPQYAKDNSKALLNLGLKFQGGLPSEDIAYLQELQASTAPQPQDTPAPEEPVTPEPTQEVAAPAPVASTQNDIPSVPVLENEGEATPAPMPVTPTGVPDLMDEAAPDPIVKEKKASAGNLISAIYVGEGTAKKYAKHGYESPYDVTLGYGKHLKGEKPVLRTKTIAQVKELMNEMKSDPNNKYKGEGGKMMPSSAVGIMQVIEPTLVKAQKALGLAEDTLFDEDTQDKITGYLLQNRGLTKYLKGDMTKAAFMKNLSKEWASIADPDTGKSYYGQATAHGMETFSPLLDTLKQEYEETGDVEFGGVSLDDLVASPQYTPTPSVAPQQRRAPRYVKPDMDDYIRPEVSHADPIEGYSYGGQEEVAGTEFRPVIEHGAATGALIESGKGVVRPILDLLEATSAATAGKQALPTKVLKQWTDEGWLKPTSFERAENPIGMVAQDLTTSMGNTLGTVGLSFINPALATAYMGSSMAGGIADDLRKVGVGDAKALASAATLALPLVAIEKVFGVEANLPKLLKGKLAKDGVKAAAIKGFLSEMPTEAAQQLIEDLGKDAIALQDAGLSSEQIIAEMGKKTKQYVASTAYAGLLGGLSGGMLGGGGRLVAGKPTDTTPPPLEDEITIMEEGEADPLEQDEEPDPTFEKQEELDKLEALVKDKDKMALRTTKERTKIETDLKKLQDTKAKFDLDEEFKAGEEFTKFTEKNEGRVTEGLDPLSIDEYQAEFVKADLPEGVSEYTTSKGESRYFVDAPTDLDPAILKQFEGSKGRAKAVEGKLVFKTPEQAKSFMEAKAPQSVIEASKTPKPPKATPKPITKQKQPSQPKPVDTKVEFEKQVEAFEKLPVKELTEQYTELFGKAPDPKMKTDEMALEVAYELDSPKTMDNRVTLKTTNNQGRQVAKNAFNTITKELGDEATFDFRIEELPNGIGGQIEWGKKGAKVTVDPRTTNKEVISSTVEEVIHHKLKQMIASDTMIKDKFKQLYHASKGALKQEVVDRYSELNTEQQAEEFTTKAIRDVIVKGINSDGTKNHKFFEWDIKSNDGFFTKVYKTFKQWLHRLLSNFKGGNQAFREDIIRDLLKNLKKDYPEYHGEGKMYSKSKPKKPLTPEQEAKKLLKEEKTAKQKKALEKVDEAAGKAAQSIDTIVRGLSKARNDFGRGIKDVMHFDPNYNTSVNNAKYTRNPKVDLWYNSQGKYILDQKPVAVKGRIKVGKDHTLSRADFNNIVKGNYTVNKALNSKVEEGAIKGSSRVRFMDAFWKGIQEYRTADNLSPYSLMKKLGAEGTEFAKVMFDDVVEGWRIDHNKVIEGEDIVKGFVDEFGEARVIATTSKIANVDSLSKAVNWFKIVRGKVKLDELNIREHPIAMVSAAGRQVNYKFTEAELINMYLNMKDPETHKFMGDFGVVLQANKDRNKPVILKFKDMSKVKVIVEGDKALNKMANKMYDFVNSQRKDDLNATSMEASGIKIADEDHYWPRITLQVFDTETDTMQTGLEIDSKVNPYAGVDTQSQFKARTSKGSPILVMDAFDVFNRHNIAASKYIGMMVPYTKARKTLDVMAPEFVSRNMSDVNISLESYLDSIGRKELNKPEQFDKMSMKLMGRWGNVVISANPGVTLKQVVSAGSLLRYYDFKSVGKAVKNTPLPFTKKGRELDAEMRHNVPIIHDRTTIVPDTGMMEQEGNMRLRQLITGKPDMGDTVMRATIGAADNQVMRLIYTAVTNEVKADASIEEGSPEYWKAVNTKIEEIIFESQPDSTTFSKTRVQRSKKGIVQGLNMFSSQRFKLNQMLRQDVRDTVKLVKEYNDAKKAGDLERGKQAVEDLKVVARKFMATHVTNIIAIGAIDALIRSMASEDKEFTEEAITAMTRNALAYPFGNWATWGIIINGLATVAAGDKNWGIQHPLYEIFDTGLGTASEVIELAKGKSMSASEARMFRRDMLELTSIGMKLPLTNLHRTMDVIATPILEAAGMEYPKVF